SLSRASGCPQERPNRPQVSPRNSRATPLGFSQGRGACRPGFAGGNDRSDRLPTAGNGVAGNPFWGLAQIARLPAALPRRYTMSHVADAVFDALRRSLGSDAVDTSEETVARYGRNDVPGGDRRPAGVVYPASTAQVQASFASRTNTASRSTASAR